MFSYNSHENSSYSNLAKMYTICLKSAKIRVLLRFSTENIEPKFSLEIKLFRFFMFCYASI